MKTIKKILTFFKDNVKSIRTTLVGILHLLVLLGVVITPAMRERILEIFTTLGAIDTALLTFFLNDSSIKK